jgi:hypothetical protein
MSIASKTAVLVAERDSEWSSWVEPLRAASDDVVVLVQRAGESPSELATRVRERVQELHLEGEITAAALVGGPSFDDATLSARALIVRAIVNQMVRSGHGRVFLDGGARSGRGRHAMAALAAVVEDQLAHTGVDVMTATPTAPELATSPQPLRRAA